MTTIKDALTQAQAFANDSRQCDRQEHLLEIITAALASLEAVELPELPKPSGTVFHSDMPRAYSSTEVQDYARQGVAAALERERNAPWLTEAHALCADHDIEPGHITDRIAALREKLAKQAGEIEALRKDAKRWQQLASYLISDDTHLDDDLIAAKSVAQMGKVIDSSTAQGETK
jgi:hypothetical protein